MRSEIRQLSAYLRLFIECAEPRAAPAEHLAHVDLGCLQHLRDLARRSAHAPPRAGPPPAGVLATAAAPVHQVTLRQRPLHIGRIHQRGQEMGRGAIVGVLDRVAAEECATAR